MTTTEAKDLPMPDTLTPPDTQSFLDALKAALDASNAPENREKREKLAEISRTMLALEADAAELTRTDQAVTDAELALKQHLDKKHGDDA